MSIKMIVSDLDGTLFNSDKKGYTVSKELIKEIKEFQERGNIFTIATGRPIETSLDVAKTVGINAPYIAYNGAKIVNSDGKEIYSEDFSLNIWIPFLEEVQKMGGSVIFYYDGQVFCLKHNERISAYEKKEIAKCNEAGKELLKQELVISKILIIGNVEIFKKIFNDLDSSLRDEFRYVISEDDYFEIVKNNVSKGNALKKLKEYLKLKDNEVATIGNHMNDKELLEEGHVGAAVFNAVDGLKGIADVVTKGEYENGVIELIRKYK